MKTSIRSFTLMNSSGGTVHSSSLGDLPATTFVVDITHVKFDDEIGWGFRADPFDPLIAKLVAQNADPQKQFLFFSESELFDQENAPGLAKAVATQAGTITTEDGYVFRLQPNGKWSDDDMTFDSLDLLMEEVGIKVGHW